MSGNLKAIGEVLERARAAAVDYARLTGKPLGITGEIGEWEAARLLDLELAPARTAGYDAIDADGTRFQIKTRRGRGMVGSIGADHEFDAVLLVILDAAFQPVGIWRAERSAVEAALAVPGSRAREERSALAMSKVKAIGRRVWPI